MTVVDETESRRQVPPIGDREADLGSRLRREQVHAALFGKPEAPARVDRFALLEPIGAGGMGELFAAYDAQLDRKIALKLVRSGRGGGKADARLMREAQALAKLSHPNVVNVYEVGRADDRVFVAMEYVHGQTLTAWLEQAQALPEPQRVRELLAHFRDAARGLAAVHRAGFAHRDFKPDNVLVGTDGRVRLVDFGLARSSEPSTSRSGSDDDALDPAVPDAHLDEFEWLTPELEVGTLTATGTLLGTPRYMAPEQWRARRGDGRSDQFSFCVALYRALFGTWPFESETAQGLRVAVVAGELREPPRKLEVPALLQAALLRGLAADPEQRGPDMSELLFAIDQTLAARRRQPGAWLLAAGSTIAITIAVLLGLRYEPPRALELADAGARVRRELAAERQRARVAAEIEALDAKHQPDDADVAFTAFAALPQSAHTRALARAWLDQAKRLRERGDPSGELAALGEAQLTSPSADQRRLGLIELARALDRGHHHAQLGATLAVLGEVGDDEVERSTELLTMRVREAASRRDFSAAIALLERPEAEPIATALLDILHQLEQVSLTDHVVTGRDFRMTAIVRLPAIDLDGDRRGELLLASDHGPAHVLASRPSLPILHDLELALPGPARPPSAQLELRPVASASSRLGAPSWLLAEIADDRTLFDLGVNADRIEARPIELDTEGMQWAVGDLFGGAGWAGWEGLGANTIHRRLVGLHATDRGFERFEPQPSLTALRSVVEDVAIADLDADGEDELIVGVGAWWAYDVRVLRPDRDAPGDFQLAARRKLGALTGMISFPAPTGRGHWIAATLPTTPPSPRVFPSDAPAGVPAGVYMLAWPGPGRALEIVDHLALPDSYRPLAADLDGDGRSELIVQLRSTAIAVLYPTADDRYSLLWLDGLIHHAAADLDGDGDDELIVSESETGRVMVLGSGDEPMPVLDRHSPTAVEPPEGLDRALRDLWARAETLAMLGLIEQARAAFVELARLADPAEAALAHRHGAELAERGGDRRQAAVLYERADDPDSLARALELDEAVHEFAAAARVAERLAAQDGIDPPTRERWQAYARRLHRRAEPDARIEIDFTEPLDDRWRIARPGLLRREPEGLRVESLGAVDPQLLRRAIVWEGDRLEIELDLDLLRLEWASQLQIALVPIDDSGQPSGGPIVARSIGSWGGGDHYTLDVSQGNALEPNSHGEDRAMRGALPPAGQHRFRARIDMLADTEQTWTSFTTLADAGPHDTELAFERPSPRHLLRPGRYELRLLSGVDPWMRGVVRLERLRILGARDDPRAAPATRREQVLLAMARSEHEQAIVLLDGALPDELDARDASWLRALALEQLGRWSLARPFLEHALGDCGSSEALGRFGHAMLIQPDRMGPTLRRICRPDRFLLDTWAVTQTPLFQHKALPDLHRTLTTQLVDLDRYEPRDVAEGLATMGLLTARARGWLMQDLASAAESDLRRVIELCERVLAASPLTVEQREEVQRIESLAHVELGVVLMARGQDDAAAAELDRALARDRAPEIMADVIAARAAFASLRSSTLWVRVTRTQLGLR